MNDGFVKAAAISTRVTVADPESNCEEVCGGILTAALAVVRSKSGR